MWARGGTDSLPLLYPHRAAAPRWDLGPELPAFPGPRVPTTARDLKSYFFQFPVGRPTPGSPTGYEMRPIFRGGEETMGVLETQCLKASGEAWGMDLFPTHGRERAERAARWTAFDDTTEKKKGKKSAVVGGDPWLVPEGIPGQGERKMCAEHRMTQCTTCKTTTECCRNHHHRCLDHEMPTCDSCKKHADLGSRRRGHCCREGHHRAAVARGEESTTKKRKAEPEGPASAPRQAKRENVVLVLPEAAEGERGPATSASTSAAKVGKTALSSGFGPGDPTGAWLCIGGAWAGRFL
ncbi:hypothetical protein DIPPA_05193 [Diplonema papillatum]|nr:hypothetical protein DIPPA_05193 [Diplonema papillatum]